MTFRLSMKLSRGFAGEAKPHPGPRANEPVEPGPGGSLPPRVQLARVTDWEWPWWEWQIGKLELEDGPIGTVHTRQIHYLGGWPSVAGTYE